MSALPHGCYNLLQSQLSCCIGLCLGWRLGLGTVGLGTIRLIRQRCHDYLHSYNPKVALISALPRINGKLGTNPKSTCGGYLKLPKAH